MSKPTKDDLRNTSYMRGRREASKGKPKANPYDPGLMHDNYERGYNSVTPRTDKGYELV